MAVMSVYVATMPLPVVLDAFLHDDSFYYLKPAENFAAGRGSSFDGINYTNGYQPAWFAVLAALYAAGVDHDAMIRVAMVVQSLCVISALFVLFGAMTRAGIDRAAAGAAIGIVFVSMVPILAWNLLEAGLTLLMTSLLLSCFVDDRVSPAKIGTVAALAGLARTDHLLFLPAAALYVWIRQRPVTRRQVIAFVVPPLVIVGSYLLLNLITTGHIVPVSGRVKALYSADWTWQAAVTNFLHIDVRESWKLGLAVAVATWIPAARRRGVGLALYAVVACAICAYYQFSYSASLNYAFWYYIPLYVLLSYGIAWAMTLLLPNIPRRVAVAGLALTLALSIAARVRTLESYTHRPEGARANAYRVAHVLKQRMQVPGSRAAAWDAGILGYFGGAVTNLDGLMNTSDYLDEYLAKGRTADYIREQRFDFLACYEPDTRPGGKAFAVLDRYTRIYEANDLIILERRP